MVAEGGDSPHQDFGGGERTAYRLNPGAGPPPQRLALGAERTSALRFSMQMSKRCTVPTGKVKFYDAAKGFGFVSDDEGGDVFVPASALPEGVTSLKGGTRIEFGIVEGRRGSQALGVRLLDPQPSVATNRKVRDRKPADEMVVIVEDVIRLLDDLSNTLRRGHYPDKAHGNKVAQVLRAVADDLEL